MPREAMLARTFVQLADTLVADYDVIEILTVVTDCCVDVLDVASAGIMLAGPEGDLRVVASSSEGMRLLELFEVQAQEGPCLDCYRTGQPIVNQDLATVNGRWLRFAPVALGAGFHSVHALPMRLRSSVIGAVNLLRVEPGELRSADVEAAQALADVATIAILQHRATLEAQVVNDQLNHALNSRIVIEQAKGMVAERLGVNMELAFTTLRTHARNHNLRLVDVAQGVIGGTLAASTLGRTPQAQTSSPGRTRRPTVTLPPLTSAPAASDKR
jgi:GAF domain-containing protein